MSEPVVRAVLFDLDGTLLDTAPDLVGTLNVLRLDEGLDPVDVEEFRRFVSRGALGLIRAGLPDRGAAAEAAWRERFLAHYAEHSFVGTRAFDGIEALLGELESRDLPWGVVTNKPTFLTTPIIAALGWDVRASCVVCGDTLAVSKPDPAPVRLACEQAGVTPEATLFVGDDPRDIEAGDAAGARSVLAAYGYGAGDVLGQPGPAPMTIEAPGDLLGLITEVDARRVGS